VPTALGDDETLLRHVIAIKDRQPSCGLAYMIGALRALGQDVQEARIRAALVLSDPHRQFYQTRPAINRRPYKVTGPNSLWHHDGQHGLIMFGFVIHAFIDGFS
jgi:hypothetical protein